MNNILDLDEQYYFRKDAYVKTQNNMDTLHKGFVKIHLFTLV